MNLTTLHRHLRRIHRKRLSPLLPWLYLISGITMLTIGESPRVQGCIHILIGIVHGLA